MRPGEEKGDRESLLHVGKIRGYVVEWDRGLVSDIQNDAQHL